MDQKNDRLSRTPVVAILAFISCALWGSAFSGVKRSYALLQIAENEWADQLVFGGLRFVIAGLMVIVIGSISSKKPLLPQKSSFHKICIISFFQTIMQYFCYYIGLAHTSGVKASVLVGTNVFLAILISSLLLRLERLTVQKIIGSLIGFSGIILINLKGLSADNSFTLIGDGLILLCTVASGFSSAFMKKLSDQENPVLLSGWQFLLGGAVLQLIGLVSGGHFPNFDLRSGLLLFYLAFISAAAYSIWAVLLKHNPVSKVSVFGFLNPVCGVFISAVVLHESEQITALFLISLMLVCAGIIIVNAAAHTKQSS